MAISASASTATQAIDALMKWKNTQSESHNPQLLPQDDFIYLVLTLKKIPQKGSENGVRTNPNKIPLPHPLISATGFSEICLIIDDRPNSKLTSQIAKKKIKEDGISVTKVIKLSKLKTDYKPFEAKRKLCDSYEMFFADKRVIPLLPKLFGKQFFRKKKLPLPIDLSHKNWKEQIERACSAALLFFRTGTCSVVRVAKLSMERDEIIENVNAAIEGIIEFVPKKLSGVRSLHLKFSESVALPLYQSLPDIKLRIEGIKETVEEEGVKTEEGGKKKKSKQGRIHEVNHDAMDEDDGAEVENNDSEVKQTKKEKKGGKDDKKKRKGGVVEENDVKTDESNKKAKKANKKVEGVGEEVKKSEEVAKKTKKKVEIVEEEDVETDVSNKKAKKKMEGVGEEVKKNEGVAKKTKKKVEIVEKEDVETDVSNKKVKKAKKKVEKDGEEVKKSEAKETKKKVEIVEQEAKKNEESGKKKKSKKERSNEGKKNQV